MTTFILVLTFPLLLTGVYSLLYLVARGRREIFQSLSSLLVYVALLGGIGRLVYGEEPLLFQQSFTYYQTLPVWILVGLFLGMTLWAIQIFVPGQATDEPPRVWVGPKGWFGFAALMVIVATIVLLEEIIWRGYLLTHAGLIVSSIAFGLHHYYFGLRHVLFAMLAGILWGSLALLEGGLWSPVASHLAYNGYAWSFMRLQHMARQKEVP